MGCVCTYTLHINVCIHISHTGGSMASENEDIASECSVCMDNKKNHVLIPCGHVCVCEECAGKDFFLLSHRKPIYSDRERGT